MIQREDEGGDNHRNRATCAGRKPRWSCSIAECEYYSKILGAHWIQAKVIALRRVVAEYPAGVYP